MSTCEILPFIIYIVKLKYIDFKKRGNPLFLICVAHITDIFIFRFAVLYIFFYPF